MNEKCIRNIQLLNSCKLNSTKRDWSLIEFWRNYRLNNTYLSSTHCQLFYIRNIRGIYLSCFDNLKLLLCPSSSAPIHKAATFQLVQLQLSPSVQQCIQIQHRPISSVLHVHVNLTLQLRPSSERQSLHVRLLAQNVSFDSCKIEESRKNASRIKRKVITSNHVPDHRFHTSTSYKGVCGGGGGQLFGMELQWQPSLIAALLEGISFTVVLFKRNKETGKTIESITRSILDTYRNPTTRGRLRATDDNWRLAWKWHHFSSAFHPATRVSFSPTPLPPPPESDRSWSLYWNKGILNHSIFVKFIDFVRFRCVGNGGRNYPDPRLNCRHDSSGDVARGLTYTWVVPGNLTLTLLQFQNWAESGWCFREKKQQQQPQRNCSRCARTNLRPIPASGGRNAPGRTPARSGMGGWIDEGETKTVIANNNER